jgi:hypothetical protein
MKDNRAEGQHIQKHKQESKQRILVFLILDRVLHFYQKHIQRNFCSGQFFLPQHRQLQLRTITCSTLKHCLGCINKGRSEAVRCSPKDSIALLVLDIDISTMSN